MPFNRNIHLPILFLLTLMTTACSKSQLHYELDPEIGDFPEAMSNFKIVALKITDNTKPSSNSLNSNQIRISPKDNQLAQIQNKLMRKLKEMNYKIISNPLLADVAIDIKFHEVELMLEKSLLKGKFTGNTHLELTISRKSKVWSKIFKATKTQEVAYPADSTDATGIINQLISEQLTKGFSDTGLEKFLLQEF